LKNPQAVPAKKVVLLELGQLQKAMQYLTDIDNRTVDVVDVLTLC
jgi:hypothetical protein